MAFNFKLFALLADDFVLSTQAFFENLQPLFPVY